MLFITSRAVSVSCVQYTKCDQICESRPLPLTIHFVLEARINTKPTFSQSLENWLSINCFPLLISWLRSSDRARSHSSMHSVQFHLPELPHAMEKCLHDADVTVTTKVSGSTLGVSVGSCMLLPNTTDQCRYKSFPLGTQQNCVLAVGRCVITIACP